MTPSKLKDDWPFADPKNVAVITTRQVFNGEPILYVSHDADDWSWQFHTGVASPREQDAMVVGLGEIVEHDPTVCELADLPYGWYAERDSIGSPWRRRRRQN